MIFYKVAILEYHNHIEICFDVYWWKTSLLFFFFLGTTADHNQFSGGESDLRDSFSTLNIHFALIFANPKDSVSNNFKC